MKNIGVILTHKHGRDAVMVRGSRVVNQEIGNDHSLGRRSSSYKHCALECSAKFLLTMGQMLISMVGVSGTYLLS